jgi:hypothetical protein
MHLRIWSATAQQLKRVQSARVRLARELADTRTLRKHSQSRRTAESVALSQEPLWHNSLQHHAEPVLPLSRGRHTWRCCSIPSTTATSPDLRLPRPGRARTQRAESTVPGRALSALPGRLPRPRGSTWVHVAHPHDHRVAVGMHHRQDRRGDCNSDAVQPAQHGDSTGQGQSGTPPGDPPERRAQDRASLCAARSQAAGRSDRYFACPKLLFPTRITERRSLLRLIRLIRVEIEVVRQREGCR